MFKLVAHEHPETSLGTTVDDRNVRHSNAQDFANIMGKFCDFDSLAGHSTNIDKSIVFGNNLVLRKMLKANIVNCAKRRSLLRSMLCFGMTFGGTCS